MEKIILEAINHIKNVSKKKLSLDTILQRITKDSATNFDTETLQVELDQMIIKGLIDHNYKILPKQNPSMNTEPSPDRVIFTIDNNEQDQTRNDYYENISFIGTQNTPILKTIGAISSTTSANADASLAFLGTQITPVTNRFQTL